VTTAKATATAPADGSKPENEPVKKAGFFSRIMGKDTAANAPAAGDAAKPAAPAASDAKAAPATSSKDAEPEPAPRKGFIRSLFSREKKTENPSKDEVAPVKDAAPAKDGPTLPPVKDDKPGSF